MHQPSRRVAIALLFVLVLPFAAWLPGAAGAQVPSHLNHQGILTDSSGVVVPDGEYGLEFGIYDAPAAGTLQFEQQLIVNVVGGLYNVLLSDNGPWVLKEAFDDPNRFLQIRIVTSPGGAYDDLTLEPRQQIASVPFAFRSDSGGAGADDEILAGAHNLIYNGSFVVWTTTDPCAGCSSVADGYAVVGNPDLDLTALTEADGQGDGDGMEITASGAGLEGIKQTLDGLKAGARYLARVAVKETAGDTCRLVTSGADTNELSVTSDAVGDWEVLAGVFQVDAVPTDVDIELLAVADGDICLFNDLGVYEINTDPVGFSGPIAILDSDNTTSAVPTALTYVPNLSVSWTPPSPGWVVQVGYQVSVETAVADGAAMVSCLLEKNGVNVIETLITWCADPEGGVFAAGQLRSSYVEANPAPGTPLTYYVKCNDNGWQSEADYNDYSNAGGTNPYSNLWLIAYPPH